MRFFSLIYQGDIHPATDDKVISAEDFSTLMQAHEILEKAKEDAEHFKKKTAEECERLKEIAKEEGYQEGLTQFNEKILFFESSLRTLRIELQKQILPLALKAAKKIVGKELESHPDAIVDIVLQALAPVTQNHQFTIYVNKVDKEALEAEKSRIKQILEHVQVLSIQERADIAPGGCIIETEGGIINATIENQWRALERAFERYMKPPS